MREVPCPACEGARLQPQSLAVTVGGRNIPRSATSRSASRASSSACSSWPSATGMIAEPILKEVNARLRFLLDVGLDYLTLDRASRHAGGRRGPAHPARLPDRQRARRRALRARRAVDRPAPARQRAGSSRRSCACATSATRSSWSSTTRRRSAPPTTSSTSGPAPASTAARSSSSGTVARSSARAALAHRPVPVRARSRSRCPTGVARRGDALAHGARAPGSTTCATSTSASRWAASWPSPG